MRINESIFTRELVAVFFGETAMRVMGLKEEGSKKVVRNARRATRRDGKHRAARANNKKRHTKKNIRVRENLRVYTNKCSFDSACPIREDRKREKMKKKKKKIKYRREGRSN